MLRPEEAAAGRPGAVDAISCTVLLLLLFEALREGAAMARKAIKPRDTVSGPTSSSRQYTYLPGELAVSAPSVRSDVAEVLAASAASSVGATGHSFEGPVIVVGCARVARGATSELRYE